MFGGWNSEFAVPRTWWWGERGLVGALFHDLSAHASLERWSEFLSCIAFSSQEHRLGVVRRAHAVVEPSFGSQGFGRPDAVAVIEFDTQQSFVLFFEAKLGVYAEAAKAPAGRSLPGFNSSINGQLELNHRLALALERWSGPAVLEEQQWILSTPYAVTKIRKVKKRDVLDTLLAPLARMPSTCYLHVILTADSNNPFDDPKIAAYMPEIFLPDLTGDQWATERVRFGWVGLSKLFELAQARQSREESSLFLDTWTFLNPKPTVDPAVPAPPVPSAPSWTATRPPRGVSLIYAPRIVPYTYLHFSWRQGNCALRDYSLSASAVPKADHTRGTHEVLPLIEEEMPTTIQRPEYTDTASWHQRVIDANRLRGL